MQESEMFKIMYRLYSYYAIFKQIKFLNKLNNLL